jgi:small-conductance mechanosensitive channel
MGRFGPVLALFGLIVASLGAQDVEEGVVSLDGESLFVIQHPYRTYTPADRAAAIQVRIRRFASSDQPIELRLTEGNGTSEIRGGQTVLIGVTDEDARSEGLTRPELAERYRQRLIQAITIYRERRNWRVLVRGSAWAAVLSLGFFALLYGSYRLQRGLRFAAYRWAADRAVRFHQSEILSSRRLSTLIGAGIRFATLLLGLLLTSFFLPAVLSFFPGTAGWSNKLLAWIIAPFLTLGASLLAFLPNLFYLVIIGFLASLMIRASRFFFREIEAGRIAFEGFYPEWGEPTFKLSRILILAMSAVAAYPYIPGSQSEAFKGISIFLGVLLSLGSSSAVSNAISGILITYTRAFQPGDRVRIGETMGDVVESTLLVTRLKTIKNVIVTLPNSQVLSGQVLNFTSMAREGRLILHTSVTIGYDAPWRTVHELLIQAALRTEAVEHEPAPFVLQTALNDFYIAYELNAYTRRADEMVAIYSELHANIQDSFNEAGVEIMSPHYAALRDGNTVAIPDSYKPDGYDAPQFRVAPPSGKAASASYASHTGTKGGQP